ncbi:Leucine-rich repeat-containing protein 49 [Gaertneriomyces sp. JEL0708]|nr:Leucine-rich repeat-containing protein 49 [Gaertneriomyces sp. JEL0708]
MLRSSSAYRRKRSNRVAPSSESSRPQSAPQSRNGSAYFIDENEVNSNNSLTKSKRTVSEVVVQYTGGQAATRQSGDKLIARLLEARRTQKRHFLPVKDAWSPSPSLKIGSLSSQKPPRPSSTDSNGSSAADSAVTLVSPVEEELPTHRTHFEGSNRRLHRASSAPVGAMRTTAWHGSAPIVLATGTYNDPNKGASPLLISELQNPTQEVGHRERLNLSRRGLQTCPPLTGDSGLRLLNYQYNAIRKIENLGHLVYLNFLDFYNNQLEHISGLENLRNLRVLMLGQNKIRKIEGLDRLTKLDVLDLHGNEISKIENLCSLTELRVLNLEGNRIVEVNDLSELRSLTELNVKRNKVRSVTSIGRLPMLRRVILSHNSIATVDAICDLFGSTSTQELWLDCNPLSVENSHRMFVVDSMRGLKVLDGKRVSEEERKYAAKVAKRELERRREMERALLEKQERERALSCIRTKWAKEGAASFDLEDCVPGATLTHCGIILAPRPPSSRPSSASKGRTLSRPKHAKLLGSEEMRMFDGDGCYVEFQEGELRIYGDALSILDKFEAGSISTIRFTYISFAKLSRALFKLRRFHNLRTLILSCNNLRRLKQINSLSVLSDIEVLDIAPDQNPLVTMPLFRIYLIYCMRHKPLLHLCGQEVSAAQRREAEAFFGTLHRVVGSLPTYNLHQSYAQDNPAIRVSASQADSVREEVQPCSGRSVTAKYHKPLAQRIAREMIENGMRKHLQIRYFDYLWPALVQEACRAELAALQIDGDGVC